MKYNQIQEPGECASEARDVWQPRARPNLDMVFTRRQAEIFVPISIVFDNFLAFPSKYEPG